jgi:carbon-monoxide dehydrogenase small subunit
MILAAVTLLERTANPGEQDVKEALAGNLCRCTGYVRIFEAVLDACRRAGTVSDQPVSGNSSNKQ